MNPIAPDPHDHTPQDDALRQYEHAERGVGLQRGGDATVSELEPGAPVAPRWRSWLLRGLVVALPLMVLLAAAGFLGGRYWLQRALHQGLPVIDGRLTVPGLAGPVTLLRDEHGVPHLRAGSMDDLVFA